MKTNPTTIRLAPRPLSLAMFAHGLRLDVLCGCMGTDSI